MQCRSCKYECPAGAQFCIQCGTSLKETPAPKAGLANTCAKCGLESPAGVSFCRGCGSSLTPSAASVLQFVTCAQCSATVSSKSKFCPKCGGAVAGVEVPPAHDPRFEPPAAPPLVMPQISIPGGPALALASAAAAPAAPAIALGVPWGRVVVLARDGSDAASHALAGEAMVLGRRGEIAFEADRFLADSHVRIEKSGTVVRLVPLDSVNGVYRRLTSQVPLENGSYVLVGREVLRFDLLDDAERTVPHTAMHGVTMFGSPSREAWGRLVQLGPSGAVRDVRYLSFPEVILGREEGDIVYRDDAFLSRRHVAFKWDGKRALLADQNSSNGTYLRARGITVVNTGDLIRIGEQVLRIELT